MKIECIELRLVRATLSKAFQTSFGVFRGRDIFLVTMHGEGLTGYAECVAIEKPWYLYETNGTAHHIMTDFLVPAILERDVQEPDELMSLFSWVRGHNMAKAALEMAFCDLSAKARGLSLSHFLGGTRARVESGCSIGIKPSIGELLEEIEHELEAGFRRIKVKIQPGWDVDVIAEIRRRFPTISLMVDANSAYSLGDLPVLRGLDSFGLLMIEQPLEHDDIIDHATLQRELRTPICLDESISGPGDARKAFEIGACRIINIKPGRVGGLTQSRRIHDVALARGMPVWCGGMIEMGVGRAHNVALASLQNFSLPGDITERASRYYTEDIIEGNPFQLSPDGTVAVPEGPGIGVEIDWPALKRLTLHQEVYGLRRQS